MKKQLYSVIALLLCFAVLFVPFLSAQAEEVGRITVSLEAKDGKPLPGGELALYTVALRDTAAETGYTLTKEFSGSGLEIRGYLTDAQAAAAAAYAVSASVPGAICPVDDKGEAKFSDLAEGLYLIAQSAPAPGYDSIAPFFVFMPTVDENGVPVYDIHAKPKPAPELPDTTLKLSAEKQVACADNIVAPDEVFSFVMVPASPDYPMPACEGAVYRAEDGAMTVSRTGAGIIELGTFSFFKADAGKTYRYTLHEVAGTNARYAYDPTVYTIDVTVSEPGTDGKISASYKITDSNGAVWDNLVFINEYKNKVPPPPIPKTGQLWWPVLLLTAAGVLLIGVGVIRRRNTGGAPDEA